MSEVGDRLIAEEDERRSRLERITQALHGAEALHQALYHLYYASDHSYRERFSLRLNLLPFLLPSLRDLLPVSLWAFLERLQDRVIPTMSMMSVVDAFVYQLRLRQAELQEAPDQVAWQRKYLYDTPNNWPFKRIFPG